MNEELISKLRQFHQLKGIIFFKDAADALESADKRIAELEAQLAEAQSLASQINTDWIPANKQLAEQLAECQKDAERWNFVIQTGKRRNKTFFLDVFMPDEKSFISHVDAAIKESNDD